MEGGKKGGGGKRVPRHQRMRPSRLSMDLIDTPSADPPPVLGEMSAAASHPSPRGTHSSSSPVGTIRVAAELLPTAAPGSSSKGTKGKGKKQQQQQQRSPRSPRSPQQPQQPQDRRHTHPRVSSPLCTEVGVASVRSPKAAAAAAAAVGSVGGSTLARHRGESDPDLEELPLDQSGDKEQHEDAAATTASPKHASASASANAEKPRTPREGAGESGSGRSGSPAVVVETLTSLAKKAVAAASGSIHVLAAREAASSTLMVAPTPIRPAEPADACTKSPTNTPAGLVMPPLPPASPFTRVKPHGGASGLSPHISSSFSKQQQPIPHITGLAGSGGGVLGAVASFPFVVGACLLACGLSQAGIEWYTT